MGIQGLERIVMEHPFFAGLDEGLRALVSGCASNARFEPDQYLLREGEPADQFYLLRQGRVALGIRAPARGELVFQTVAEGDVVGVSWLIPPYRWASDARALDVVHAIAIDAACLRRKCEEDHDFGYAMMQCFLPTLIQRLHAARLQILDVYGTPA